MHGRLGLLTALVVASLCLLGVLPRPAEATFPGRPGVIVFNLASFGLEARSELYAIEPWQSEPRQLTWNHLDGEPSFAPSGRRFAFARSGPGRPGIYQYEMSSGRVTLLVRGKSARSPAFGRKGMVAFVRSTPIGRDLFLRTASGKVRRLTRTAKIQEEEPVFMPNGRRIVFLRRAGSLKQIEIWSIRTEGGHLRQIDDGRDQYRPDVAPNGRWVALESLFSFLPVFHLGTGIHQQALRSDAERPSFEDAACPTYSPGGGKIAFSNYEGLWIAPVDGDAEARTLIYRTWDGPPAEPDLWPNDLAWQPEPRDRG